MTDDEVGVVVVEGDGRRLIGVPVHQDQLDAMLDGQAEGCCAD